MRANQNRPSNADVGCQRRGRRGDGRHKIVENKSAASRRRFAAKIHFRLEVVATGTNGPAAAVFSHGSLESASSSPRALVIGSPGPGRGWKIGVLSPLATGGRLTPRFGSCSPQPTKLRSRPFFSFFPFCLSTSAPVVSFFEHLNFVHLRRSSNTVVLRRDR